jgi:hypothetical protein
VKHAKGEENGKAAGKGNPDPPSPYLPAGSSEQTPFERFLDFAQKVVAVPRSEIEEQERIYQSQRRTRKKRGDP